MTRGLFRNKQPSLSWKGDSMNVRKENDLLKQKNIELQQEITKYRDQYSALKKENTDEHKEVTALIDDLENLRNEWIENIKGLKEKRDRYDEILYEVEGIKNAVMKKSIKLLFKWIIRSIWYSCCRMFSNIFKHKKR